MFTFLMVICGLLMLAGGTKGTVTYLSSRNPVKGLDYHHIRDNEMAIWGEYYTELQCKPNCKKCKVTPKALPKPPKGPGPGGTHRRIDEISRKLDAKCKTCHTELYANSRDTCQKCTLKLLKDRHKYRQPNTPRERQIEHEGIMYRALMPSEVPDNAHVDMMLPDYSIREQFIGTWAVWKWTDEKTGRQMILRSMAHQMERYDIMSYGSSKPINTFYSAPEIRSTKGYK